MLVTCVCCCHQEVGIKHQGHSLSFAFVQFDNIRSVVTALREMDGEQIGLNKVKVSDYTVDSDKCGCKANRVNGEMYIALLQVGLIAK